MTKTKTAVVLKTQPKQNGKQTNNNNNNNKKRTSFKLDFNRNQTTKSTLIPAWVYSVAAPWERQSAHVPDSAVAPSGVCTSHVQFTGAINSVNASNTHQFGLVLPAYPAYTFLQDFGTYLSDVDTTGVNFITPFSTSTQAGPLQPPNVASVLGTTVANGNRSRIRCTGIGVTIVYQGSELNRSGKFSVGTVPMNSYGNVLASTGTKVSAAAAALSNGANSVAFTPADLRTQSTKYFEQRNSDQPLSVRWIPQGAPTYQLCGPLGYYVQGAGSDPTAPTLWCNDAGGPGVQSGQSALVIMMTGDYTTSSATTGNVYTVDIYWNWEVIPDVVESVAYTLTPSPSSAPILDKALNIFQSMTLSALEGNGQSAR